MPKRSPAAPTTPVSTPVQVIDPRWLLKAAALTCAAALLCAYATLCLLFYQGQWQLVLTPTANLTTTPASLSLNFTPITFGSTKLTGWWLPSDSSTTDPTALVLHNGVGNMADALHSAQALHAARLNVLLFDYRGFGQSPGPHPTQARMEEDAESALEYLKHTRNIPASAIILYGERSGAAIAVYLAQHHSDLPGMMLIEPEGDFTRQAKQDSRARLAPVSLLFHERFPLEEPLKRLSTPKLILWSDLQKNLPDLRIVADPKLTVLVRSESDLAAEPLRSINRFLDTYVSRTPPQLQH